jgi:diguanylate cyclase (GGDEF)-like protein
LNFLASFEKRSKPFVIAVAFALIGVVGILDFLTGYEFEFLLFYLIPIFLVTWITGQRVGILASLVSALVSFISDVAAGKAYSHPLIYVWNTLMEFAFFVVIALLLSMLKRALEHEKELSNTDYLTGAVNSRVFYDSLQTEINRSQRYKNPFTIAYIDLDNFKTVNDEFGHNTGDQVLRFVVNQVRKHLRKTDIVARLGGDEFALLLPETNQESAQIVLAKLQYDILAETQQNNWPVTLSIGVLTCIDTPHAAEEVVKMVDDLMYSVKRGSKNDIKYATYTD